MPILSSFVIYNAFRFAYHKRFAYISENDYCTEAKSKSVLRKLGELFEYK